MNILVQNSYLSQLQATNLQLNDFTPRTLFTFEKFDIVRLDN